MSAIRRWMVASEDTSFALDGQRLSGPCAAWSCDGDPDGASFEQRYGCKDRENSIAATLQWWRNGDAHDGLPPEGLAARTA
jgi:hypothetical protein